MEVKSWSLSRGKPYEFGWHFECRWCGHKLSYNDRKQEVCPYCLKGDLKEERL